MKRNIVAFSVFLLVVIVVIIGVLFIGGKDKNGEEKETDKSVENINIDSKYPVRTDEECFKQASNLTSFYYEQPNNKEPYCLVTPSEIDGYKVETLLGISNSAITELYVSDGVKSIDISGCDNLEKIVFADSVECISIHNMNGENTEKTLEIIWPENDNLLIEGILDVPRLRELYIPDSVKELGPVTGLGSCDDLVKLVLPQGLEIMGSDTVWNLSSLEEIEIPSSVSSIGFNSIYACEKLTTIILHEGLVEIGENCFSYLPNCDFIDVPDSVQKIGMGSFMDRINDEGEYDNTVITMGVGKGSYAEQYAIENGIKYVYH